jgi:hypothetical protein
MPPFEAFQPQNRRVLAVIADDIAMMSAPESANAARPVTAIDIAFEPDQAMTGHALAANAALLKDFPNGYALDATHHAHISILVGYVPNSDLPKVYAAAGEVFAKETYTAWQLTAFKYYYIPLGPVGLAGIVVKPTTDLLRLQSALHEAVGPYMAKTGTAAAFYTTPEEPEILPVLIPGVGTYWEDNGGAKFSPHVTTGIGTKAFLDALLAEPFSTFTFSPASASVYQFGNYGTARRQLKAFPARG